MIKLITTLTLILCSMHISAQVTHTVSVAIDIPVNCETLGTTEEELRGFSVYPNPAKDQVMIEATLQENIDEITIVNLLGQKVKNIKFTSTRNKVSITTSNLKTGVYFLEIKTLKRKYNHRLMVNKN